MLLLTWVNNFSVFWLFVASIPRLGWFSLAAYYSRDLLHIPTPRRFD